MASMVIKVPYLPAPLVAGFFLARRSIAASSQRPAYPPATARARRVPAYLV